MTGRNAEARTFQRNHSNPDRHLAPLFLPPKFHRSSNPTFREHHPEMRRGCCIIIQLHLYEEKPSHLVPKEDKHLLFKLSPNCCLIQEKSPSLSEEVETCFEFTKDSKNESDTV
ncbi:unnamed protein product [Larinioides sclopetarius]|uniref:Ycf15 n=1 Tax=Larinioides sclopetarius TaxID=280406 RepID=A0AAV2BS19_9ARAC